MQMEDNSDEVRKHRVWMRINDVEKATITKKAERAGISVSKFVREAALNIKIQSMADTKAVEEMVKINADLGRLGRLFKLAINDKAANRMFKKEDLENLLKNIESQIQTMRNVMKKVNAF